MQISSTSSVAQMAGKLSGTGKNVVSDPGTIASSKSGSTSSTSSSSSTGSSSSVSSSSSTDPKTLEKQIQSLQNEVTQLSSSNDNGQNDDQITKLKNEIAELQKQLAKAEAAAADETKAAQASAGTKPADAQQAATESAATFGPAYQVELSSQQPVGADTTDTSADTQ